MPIEIITEEQKKKNLALNIVSREREMYNYQVNIDNYTAMLAALPSELPENLSQFSSINPDTIPDVVPVEDIITVSNYYQRKKIERLLKTEIIEQSKTKSVKDAMVEQIDSEELDQLIENVLSAEAQ